MSSSRLTPAGHHLNELDAACRKRGWRVGLKSRLVEQDGEMRASLDSIEVFDRLHDEGGLVARLVLCGTVELTAEKLLRMMISQGLLEARSEPDGDEGDCNPLVS